MTCVIGYRDPKNGRVYIGTDSCGGNLALARQFTRKDRKVFKLRDDEDTLIGFCGSFRMGQLLMRAEGLLEEPILEDLTEEDLEDLTEEELEEIEENKDDAQKVTYKKVEEVNFDTMVDVFIPNSINLLMEGGFAVQGENGIEGGVFLVANKDKLFRIDGDFQVGEYEDDFIAIGSGETFAYGALEALKNTRMSIPKRIEVALRSAAKYAMGVQGPFVIMNTADNEIIKVDK